MVLGAALDKDDHCGAPPGPLGAAPPRRRESLSLERLEGRRRTNTEGETASHGENDGATLVLGNFQGVVVIDMGRVKVRYNTTINFDCRMHFPAGGYRLRLNVQKLWQQYSSA